MSVLQGQAHGRVDDLRTRADHGDWPATKRLTTLLAKQGQVDEAVNVLRTRVAGRDDVEAAAHLVKLLIANDRIGDAMGFLRTFASTAGIYMPAAIALESYFFKRGEIDQAIMVVRPFADAGDPGAADELAFLLTRQGRLDEAIPIVRAAVERARIYREQHTAELADLLARTGNLAELRALADAGDWPAISRLADVLAEQGRVSDAVELLRNRVYSVGGAGPNQKLVQILAQYDEVDELRALALSGYDYARTQLARLVARRG